MYNVVSQPNQANSPKSGSPHLWPLPAIVLGLSVWRTDSADFPRRMRTWRFSASTPTLAACMSACSGLPGRSVAAHLGTTRIHQVMHCHSWIFQYSVKYNTDYFRLRHTKMSNRSLQARLRSCDFLWSNCFYLAVSNGTRHNEICKAGCLPDCQGVTFETHTTQEDLSEEEIIM